MPPAKNTANTSTRKRFINAQPFKFE